jgi:hypothetical protein
MDENVRECFRNLESSDDGIRMEALQTVLAITDNQVDWVYEVWDNLLAKLDHENSYQRTIAIKVLCNLAKSDVENRLETSLSCILAHTKDEKFITSRQCLQSIWRLALTNKSNQKRVLDHLEMRYKECTAEKHYNLLRQDIIQSIQCLYDVEKDSTLINMAQELIQEETEEKYSKKYLAILKA